MFDELKGRTITRVEFPNETRLIFHTTEGPLAYDAEGDCCSQSWVESISANLFAVTDATVREIREKRLTFDGTRQEEDKVDFVTLVTDKGYFDIEFRNSSNGYYGGWMQLDKAYSA